MVMAVTDIDVVINNFEFYTHISNFGTFEVESDLAICYIFEVNISNLKRRRIQNFKIEGSLDFL